MAVKAAGSVTVASITDVASTTRWYLLQSSTLTAPAKPTASPPGGSWSATEPTYTEGSTNSLYTCDLTTFSDGTWAYSSVSLSSSYEASKTAYNKAVAAAAAAAATDQHFWADTDGAHVSSTGDHDLSGANLLLTATRLAFRNALTELFSIIVSGTSAVISMLGGRLRIAYEKLYPTDESMTATISSVGNLALSSDVSSVLDYHHTVTDAEAAYDTTLVPAGTVLRGDVVAENYDDMGGAYSEIRASSTHGTTTHSALVMLRSGYTTKGGSEEGSTAEILADRLTYNSGRVLGDTVLYNGGSALAYDTAPGAGTAGTVTLSETAANFKELTIFYHYDVWACSSVTLTNPSGKTAGLYLMFVGADGNLWIKTRNIAIGGTSITNATNAANLAFSLTDGACLIADSYDTPEITIDRVEGRR